MRVFTPGSQNVGGFRLDPVRAKRGVDCAVLCGACNHQIAQRRRKLLVFAQPQLQNAAVRLPATVDCPFCHVPNLLDPKRLNVDGCQDFDSAPGDGYGGAIGLQIF